MTAFVVVAYDYHQSGGANCTLDEKRVLSERNMLDGDRSILDVTAAFKGRLTNITGCWSTYIAAFLAETKLNRRNTKYYEQGEDATTLLVSMENSEGGDESALPKSLKTGAQVAIAFLRELKDSKAQERMVLTITKMFGEDAAVLISGLISRVNLASKIDDQMKQDQEKRQDCAGVQAHNKSIFGIIGQLLASYKDEDPEKYTDYKENFQMLAGITKDHMEHHEKLTEARYDSTSKWGRHNPTGVLSIELENVISFQFDEGGSLMRVVSRDQLSSVATERNIQYFSMCFNRAQAVREIRRWDHFVDAMYDDFYGHWSIALTRLVTFGSSYQHRSREVVRPCVHHARPSLIGLCLLDFVEGICLGDVLNPRDWGSLGIPLKS
jgi:hypothetical protein